MYRGLRTEIQRIILFMGFCALIGWLAGAEAWGLIIGSLLYGIFLLRQMQRFYIWLSHHSDRPPPSSSGIWGDIFDAIYRMRKQQAIQQQDLMQQLTRMQDSTAALKDGAVLLDNRGQIEFWNASAEKLLGLRHDTDRQQKLTNLLRDPQFVAYFQHEQYAEPLTLHSPISSDGFLEIQINVFGDNEKLVVVRDVTRLQKLEKIRSDFVANVSHELRTPLTVLKGYLETLEDQSADLPQQFTLPAHWHKAINHMQQQTARMQSLVDDLMLLSKLEAKNTDQNQSVAVDLAALAQYLRDDAQRISPQHNIIMEGNTLHVLANRNELHSAIGNLVTNALRYSPPDSTVTLHWGTDDDGAFFSVADQGPGIAAAHIPRLTERFYRIDTGRGRADGGTGLGLAIVKHALARNNGQLDIASTPGKGSTFTCRFPASSVL
ncbi:MAG TPA: phosphate regulon sensor histidine kinase PhoR [Pseudomonadales bacterium]|nr:phosphate regulon sensor histidine kinase PhoR [Pseudomonadales bacterium]